MIRSGLVVCCALLLGCGSAHKPVETPPVQVKAQRAIGTENPGVAALPASLRLFSRTTPEQARVTSRKITSRGESWKSLAPDIHRSLEYARRWDPQARAAEHDGMRINWAEVSASLELLESLLPELDAHPELLAERFEWFQVTPEVRFTGYFSPILSASHTRKPGYEYPIYRLPEELAPELAWCLPEHNCPEDAFFKVIRPEKPFHGRAEIDLDGVLRGRNLEMAWLQHPIDTYELMLEGSGILSFEDGTQRAALFAGLNGNPGRSLAGYLIRAGELPRNRSSMRAIRDWWDANPRKRRALLTASSGYAFFRYGGEHPLGTAHCELTPWVSMAVDPQVIPLAGIVAYALPGQGKIRYGLGFAQDTGSAIKLRRIDMYTGEGDAAHRQAMQISHQGQVWLLLRKNR